MREAAKQLVVENSNHELHTACFDWAFIHVVLFGSSRRGCTAQTDLLPLLHIIDGAKYEVACQQKQKQKHQNETKTPSEPSARGTEEEHLMGRFRVIFWLC